LSAYRPIKTDLAPQVDKKKHSKNNHHAPKKPKAELTPNTVRKNMKSPCGVIPAKEEIHLASLKIPLGIG
jgi:hypothetical protein